MIFITILPHSQRDLILGNLTLSASENLLINTELLSCGDVQVAI